MHLAELQGPLLGGPDPGRAGVCLEASVGGGSWWAFVRRQAQARLWWDQGRVGLDRRHAELRVGEGGRPTDPAAQVKAAMPRPPSATLRPDCLVTPMMLSL